jgi:hypothetical protein
MKFFLTPISIVLILFSSTYSNAQVVEFEKVYGGNGYDYGYSVAQTFDKGYIIAGSTTSFGNGGTDAYILKTDSMGVAEWQKTFGGINIDQAYSIKQTSDSGFVIAGYTNSYGFGGYDMYLIKTDKYGDTTWTKTYGGSNWDFAYSVEQTSDGGYIITGGTYSFGKGDEDMYLVKTNAAGDTLWTKTYGGTNTDEARSVKSTSDGGYIITGNTKSFGDINGDFYTVKTNSTGDTLWTKKNGGVNEDDAFEIIENNAGGYIIGGKTKSAGNGNFDGLIIKLSSTGLTLSGPTYGGTDDDGINSIKQSADGRFAMAGYTYSYGFGFGTSDCLLYIENPYNGFHSGTYGGSNTDKAYSINTTQDGGYIICGTSLSYSNLDHIFLIKTDSNSVSPTTATTTLTSINNLTTGKTETDFKIYPNPTSNNFYVSITSFKKLHNSSIVISIADIVGRKYYQKAFSDATLEPIEINAGNLNAGIYIVTLESNNFSFNQKLIIEH